MPSCAYHIDSLGKLQILALLGGTAPQLALAVGNRHAKLLGIANQQASLCRFYAEWTFGCCLPDAGQRGVEIEENGSILCRELLAKNQKKMCPVFINYAAKYLEDECK